MEISFYEELTRKSRIKVKERYCVYSFSSEEWSQIKRTIGAYRKKKKNIKKSEEERKIEEFIRQYQDNDNEIKFIEMLKKNDTISKKFQCELQGDRIEFRVGYLPYQSIFKDKEK
jgi:hypothetical protein